MSFIEYMTDEEIVEDAIYGKFPTTLNEESVMDYIEIDDAEAFDQQAQEEASYFAALSRIAEEINRYDLNTVMYDLFANGYINSDEFKLPEDLAA